MTNCRCRSRFSTNGRMARLERNNSRTKTISVHIKETETAIYIILLAA